MAEGRIKNTELAAIAAAIRSKNGEITVYKPGEMAAAILAIPAGYPEPTGSISITQNGTANVKDYASASVNVPNSYSQSDEGKVVSNGELVAQTARSSAITANGTYDTTTNNSVTVNVSGGSELPSGYRRVAFVGRWNGGAYFDSLLKSTANFGFTIKFESRISSYQNLFGGYNDVDALLYLATDHTGLTFYYNNSDAYVSFGSYTSGTYVEVNFRCVDGEITCWLNNNTPSTKNGTTANNATVAICTFADTGASLRDANTFNGRIFELEFYDGNTCVSRMLPCVRESDGVAGLYDTVRDSFFASTSSSTFEFGG